MRVLVVSTVHHPEDARIHERQVAAMLGAGWEVTQAGAWSAHGLPVPVAAPERPLTGIDLPHASGRRRLAALRAEQQALAERIERIASGEDTVLDERRAVERLDDVLTQAADLPVDFARVRAADWVGLPEFTTPTFDIAVLALFVPVVLALAAATAAGWWWRRWPLMSRTAISTPTRRPWAR